MTEYYVELQDTDGTCYGATDCRDEVLYFDDLDDARMFAKSNLNDEFVVVRVIDSGSKQIVDFFKS